MPKNKYPYPQCILGNIKRDDNNILYCYICTVNSEWHIHKSDDTHLSKVWFFKKQFHDGEGEEFYCDMCKLWISKCLFQRHALHDHQLPSWYNIYFNHCIQLHENVYYCHLCKYKNLHRYLLLNHIDTEFHQMNLKKYMPIKPKTDLSLELNQKFVINSIFPHQSSQLKCWSCNCYLDRNEITDDHISSESHKNNLTKMKISLGGDRNSKFCTTTDNTLMICGKIDNLTESLQPIDTFPTENKFLQYFENFIGLHKDSFRCNLCREKFSSENLVYEHLKKDNHCLLKAKLYKNYKIDILKNSSAELCKRLISNYIFPKTKTEVKCIICLKSMGYNNIEEHINGRRHRNSCKSKVLHPLLVEKNNILAEIENASINKVENDATEDILTDQFVEESDNILIKYFKNYITKWDNDYSCYYCYLCNDTFSSSTLVLTHIDKPIHHNQMTIEIKTNQIGEITYSSYVIELFVKNGVFRYDNGLLKCFVCKCSLDNCAKALSHIDNEEHKKTKANSENEPIEEIKMEHLDIDSNKNFRKLNIYNLNEESELPIAVEKLLIEANEISMKKLTKLEQEKNEMECNQELLVDNLRNTIGEYVDAKIYLFGSRVSGLGSVDSDLDIFLDCDNFYHTGSISDDISFFLNKVKTLLKQSKDIWTINRTISQCRIPIIKVTHKLTNIDCDISFTNGLAVENTKLIKKYIEAYPMCKRLILFLKDWLKMCGLGGEKKGISSYAITWMVIYYLQTKFILPNVTQLMKFKEKSCVIDIWETGVSNDIDVSVMSKNFSFLDLLRGFFTMAANFDYRHNIMCPLLGRPVKKIDFITPHNRENLPIEMNSYRNYINRNNKDAEYFRAHAEMALQDPFDLSHNLTKLVEKATLHQFKTYCKLSAEKLID